MLYLVLLVCYVVFVDDLGVVGGCCFVSSSSDPTRSTHKLLSLLRVSLEAQSFSALRFKLLSPTLTLLLPPLFFSKS